MKPFLTTSRRMGVLVTFFLSILFASCTGCPQLCHCDTKAVDCSNLNLTSVPRDIPSNTSNLRLHNNRLVSLNSSDFDILTELQILTLNSNLIKSIGNETFGNLRNLTELFLHENAIESINGETFKGAMQLEILNVGDNLDMWVQPSAFMSIPRLRNLNLRGTTFVENYDFSNLNNLEILTISNCSLKRIDAANFRGLPMLKTFYAKDNHLEDITFISSIPSLEMLNLDRNMIVEINTKAFGNNKALTGVHFTGNKITSLASESLIGTTDSRHFYLNDNQIETFPNDILGELFGNETLRVYLDGNPINCNQEMKWMTSFLHKDIFYGANCSSPDCIKGRDVTTLASCEFDCDDTESSDSNVTLGLIIALSVTSMLLVLLCGLVCVTSYYKGRMQSRYATLNEMSLSS